MGAGNYQNPSCEFANKTPFDEVYICVKKEKCLEKQKRKYGDKIICNKLLEEETRNMLSGELELVVE